ncbi:MAG: hypothetical protein Q4G45_12540 [Actinomycetia bacterium]|nr:hypothetical protein [Actinomycetes bacterium]
MLMVGGAALLLVTSMALASLRKTTRMATLMVLPWQGRTGAGGRH